MKCCRITLSALVALSVCGLGLTASPTIAAPPRTDGIDIQQFRPGAGASDYLHVLGGFMGRHLGLAASVLYDHATTPLVVDRHGTGAKNPLVASQDTLQLGASFGLWERLELGVMMPLILDQGVGPGFASVAPGAPAPNGFYLGDLRITPKIRLVGDGHRFALTLAAPLSVPTGGSFGGYGALSVDPRVVIDWNPAYYVRLTVNLGARFRENGAFDGLQLGDELTWGVGLKLSFFLGDEFFSLLNSFSGSFELPDRKTEAPPFEFLSALEWRALKDFAIFAGAGAGVTRGYGSPDFRALVGLRYNGYRDCPYGEEDFDGWEDEDGCADLDNDGDGIPDDLDLCPNEAETFNGWMDGDGCPDEPIVLSSVLDGREDPSALTRDSDGDGIPDAYDHCPDEAEDFDGFEDGDGCPEPDNDRDGVLDIDDKCPLEAEVRNGFEDDDGCPDVPKGPVRINDMERQITITDKVYFDTGRATIQKRSFALLDAIAEVLAARPDITRIRVEGHTDDVGPADVNRRLSAERANSVVTYLIEHGIVADRLEAQGHGEDVPIASNRSAKGRAENRRVEFRIIGYAEDAGGEHRGTDAPIPVPE